MPDTKSNRLTILSLCLLIPAILFLSWWAWLGLEDNRLAERRHLHHQEELASYQVVNNLGLELFHLSFTFSLGLRQARPVEAILTTYQREAHFPGLLQDVFLVKTSPTNESVWLRWSSGRWVPLAPPEWAPPVSELLKERVEPTVNLETPTMSFVLPQRGRDRAALLVRYNVKTVLDTIVPALVKKAFNDSGLGQSFGVSVFRQERGTGVLDPPADLIVPLVPLVPFSDWLAIYLDRTGIPFPDAAADQFVEAARYGLPMAARWSLAINLLPRGLAGFDEETSYQNEAAAGLLFLILFLGFGLFLLSIRRLLQAAARERAFTTLVSHELKTPLAAIRSLSENLLEGVVSDPAKVKDYGAEILGQTDRLGELVGNVLLLARLKTSGTKMTTETFDLADLAVEAASRADLPVTDPGTDPWLAVGNRAAVRAALDNLVTNALRYGFHEGTTPLIVVDLQRDFRGGHRWVGVSVTDHGPGIPPEEKKALFRPFRRGRVANRRQVPGGGIGLSLVKSTLSHLKGRVQIRPVPGGGLSVILWLREGESI